MIEEWEISRLHYSEAILNVCGQEAAEQLSGVWILTHVQPVCKDAG